MTRVGIGGLARDANKYFVGVGNVAREVSEVYAGVDGVRRLVWKKEEESGGPTVEYWLSHIYSDMWDVDYPLEYYFDDVATGEDFGLTIVTVPNFGFPQVAESMSEVPFGAWCIKPTNFEEYLVYVTETYKGYLMIDVFMIMQESEWWP